MSNSTLSVPPASTSSASAVPGVCDFDFLIGRWHVQNDRLALPLERPDTWDRFDATLTVWPDCVSAPFQRLVIF